MAPVVLPCPAGGNCAYETPALEVADALKMLEMHKEMSHGSDASRSDHKPEKFPRPSIGMDESSERWDDFEASWNQYKDEYKLAGNRLTRQLFACCTQELATGLSRLTCGKHFELEERDLLARMKELSVLYQNPAVFVQNFLNTIQQQDENVRHFLSRLKGIASHCNFQTKCSCGIQVSYAEDVIRFKLVAGLIDEEIKEDILGAGEKSLEETVKAIEAKESAKRAKGSLVHTPTTPSEVSKVSEAKRGGRQGGCSHCGRNDHNSAQEDRRKSCPAFDKKCDKCGKIGHFRKKCLSKVKKQEKSEAAEVKRILLKWRLFRLGRQLLMYVLASVNKELKKQTTTVKVPNMVYRELKWVKKITFYAPHNHLECGSRNFGIQGSRHNTSFSYEKTQC